MDTDITTNSFNPSCTPHWEKLHQYSINSGHLNIARMLKQNPGRAEQLRVQWQGFYFDYAKSLIDDASLAELFSLAEASPLKQCMAAMTSGATINRSEGRPVLHCALRDPDNFDIDVDGGNVGQSVKDSLQKIADFSARIRSGQWLGSTGKAITDVINIGIGGSDLGPKMVCQALQQYAQQGINCHFISNVDGAEILSLTQRLNAETTLVIITSKTFTTQETLLNAKTALAWLQEKLGLAQPQNSPHVIGITANTGNAQEYGIPAEQIVEFGTWVGGRYSLWSGVGLAIAISIGYEAFEELLAGAKAMDEHFFNAEYAQNIPVILALLSIWYNNFLGAQSCAVIPYCERLTHLPTYLQQLEMESNGKSVNQNGEALGYNSGGVIWGQPGTNGQHAFFQLLHQGTHLIPVQFIGAVNDDLSNDEHHQVLLQNMLAQGAALMLGSEQADAPGYAHYPGNRPSTTLLMDKLTPFNCGALIALYEHKVFAEGVLWGINSFDQWGVELGKKIAKQLAKDSDNGNWDASTKQLLKLLSKGSK
ncbi:glucose-6-phosphate isomerase [Porticoccus sp. W117]|uniref:glucose-6-phosphate isomerase n=1 Tax=Porticoccus sp. W117 TaxID=3054777 RepID=UPI0025992F37|nr:glucose-6-phosphate isomerase [Porticoccus sp. W117]MDM3872326.1 glucose-6-phosphate isomerase [Porticoccus sp. W117]